MGLFLDGLKFISIFAGFLCAESFNEMARRVRVIPKKINNLSFW
jgi:hypothetical protein